MNINYIHPADQLVMFMQRIYDKGMQEECMNNIFKPTVEALKKEGFKIVEH